MVIPMQSPGMQLAGPPPPEAAEPLKNMKWAVIGMMGSGAARFLLGSFSLPMGSNDFVSTLQIFAACCMAAFTLKEDPHLSKFYECLVTSICQQCAERGMGGMNCLFPFIIFDGINVVFDIMKIGYIGVMPYGLALMVSMASQAAAAYFAWQAYKICQESAPSNSGVEMEGGSSNYVQQRDDGGSGSARTVNPGALGAGGGGGGGGNFNVFSGSGQRLGS